MIPARRSIGAALALLLLIGGGAALAAARWTAPIAEADAALAAGDVEAARAGYAAAQARFDRRPALRAMFARDYARAVAAQLAIDYQAARYDAVIDQAPRAPETAAPHFWAGLAYYAKSRGDGKPEEQFAWLNRAEEELRRAVEAAPADWDAKYDFELVTRLAAALRRQPHVPPNQLMHLLRPQPRPNAKPGRHVG